MIAGPTRAPKSGHRVRLPKELIYFTAIGVLLSGLSPNPGQTGLGVAVVPVLFLLLWRANEVPVLLFVAGYQWLQVMLPVLSANFAGIELQNHPEIPNLGYGAYIAIFSILFLGLGMRLGRGPLRPELVRDAFREIECLSEKKLLLSYVGAHIVAELATLAASVVPGLSQPLSALRGIFWVYVFIIMFAGIVSPRLRWLAMLVFAIEFLSGFLGYFSAFKSILFVTIVAIVAANKTGKKLLRFDLVVAILGLLIFAVIWQAVKEDYREFLNQGTNSQDVLVPVPERIDFLANSLGSVTEEKIRRGFESGIDRAGYLEYLSRSTYMVPAMIPYQDGRLIMEAIRHPLQPRIFFPNKPSIDDSDRVNEFAGVRVADSEYGTSISLGYVAEAYIDFGPYLMMLSVMGMGFMWGMFYRVLSNGSRCRLVSLGFATSLILSQAIYFESSNMKLIGGTLSYFVGAFLIIRFIDKWLWKAISARRGTDNRSLTRR